MVDFINGILFYGNAIIHFDDISLADSNLDSHLPIQNITRERERDNIYLVKIDDHECLIGIEHQSQIDRSMFQRTREYDEMNYLQQFFPIPIQSSDDYGCHDIGCLTGKRNGVLLEHTRT